MKVVISGYGKMGHMVESSLLKHGIELACATEDVCAVPDALAADCVCIDYHTGSIPAELSCACTQIQGGGRGNYRMV